MKKVLGKTFTALKRAATGERERERGEEQGERESKSKCNGASGDAYRRRQCQYPCHFGTLSFGAATPQTTHMWYVHMHTCVCVCGSVLVCALPNGAKSEAHTARQASRPE